MAITLNKFAIRCFESDVSAGKLSLDSSARPLIYDISRSWRRLLESTNRKPSEDWSMKEEAAGEIIISAAIYLHRIGCKNIEQLLKDMMERRIRHN